MEVASGFSTSDLTSIITIVAVICCERDAIGVFVYLGGVGPFESLFVFDLRDFFVVCYSPFWGVRGAGVY